MNPTRSARWPACVSLVLASSVILASEQTSLQVVDEAGRPVARFESMIHTDGEGYLSWAGTHERGIWAHSFQRSQRVDVLVRAEGFATAVEIFEGERLNRWRSARIVFQRGEPVELKFKLPEGMTWPDKALPETYFGDYEERVRIARQRSSRGLTPSDFNMLNLRPTEGGRFEFRLTSETPPFYVAVHHPRFLQHFESGPFTLADFVDGVLEVELPRPARLRMAFSPPSAAYEPLPFKFVALDLMWNLPDTGNTYIDVKSVSDPCFQPRVLITDLAPGKYMVWVRTQPKEGVANLPGTEINLGKYHDREAVVLQAGQEKQVQFEFHLYNPDAFRGDLSATVRVLAPDGRPASGRTLTVGYWDGHYGSLEVFRGPIPESGEVALRNITARAQRDAPGPYTVQVDDKMLGLFSLAGKEDGAELEFRIAPQAGDLAPDFPLVQIATGKQVRLQDFRGKLVLIELWASWCGPCQPAMEKLHQVAREKSNLWQDDVVLLPLSIDDSAKHAASHVARRGWRELTHYWTGSEDLVGTQSPGARAFVVSGVPTTVLIGRDGRIVWRGHPLETSEGFDLATRIERALRHD